MCGMSTTRMCSGHRIVQFRVLISGRIVIVHQPSLHSIQSIGAPYGLACLNNFVQLEVFHQALFSVIWKEKVNTSGVTSLISIYFPTHELRN